MKALIIYGSKYGTTKAYAEKFSKMTGFDVKNYTDIKDLAGYDLIIHFGGMYAGAVKGLKKVTKLVEPGAKMIVASVGLADDTDENIVTRIKSSVLKQIPENLRDNATVFHLRGGIDYQKLNFSDSLMMKFAQKKREKIPVEKRTPDVERMIKAYPGKIDFTDFNSLDKIKKCIE